MRLLVLLLLALASLTGCSADDGSTDASVLPDLSSVRDLTADPIVGRACGAGIGSCPCGYFCPMGKCEVADFHPPCGDGGI